MPLSLGSSSYILTFSIWLSFQHSPLSKCWLEGTNQKRLTMFHGGTKAWKEAGYPSETVHEIKWKQLRSS